MRLESPCAIDHDYIPLKATIHARIYCVEYRVVGLFPLASASMVLLQH